MNLRENVPLSSLSWLLILTFLDMLWTINGQTIQDAAVYPGKKRTKMKLTFSNVADFSNLDQTVKEEGFLEIGLFCVKRGAFVLYRDPNFEVQDPASDITIVSGNDNCYKPMKLGSAQPLGPIHQPKQDSITFFTKPYFASLGKGTTVSAPDKFFTSMGSSIKSLILVGRTSWTIMTAAGKKFCVVGKGLKKEISPICLFPDFSQSWLKQPALRIITVKRGCKEVGTTISITFCQPWGKAEPIGEEESKGNTEDEDGAPGKGLVGRAELKACEAPGGAEAKLLNDTLKLFKAVLTNSFDNWVILDWPGFGKDKWKLEMLDLVFDMAKIVIPDELISDSYMNRIRELFLYSLEKAWVKSPSGENSTDIGGNDGDIAAGDQRLHMLTEYDYRGMIYQTEECLMRLDGSAGNLGLAKWTAITHPDLVDSLFPDSLKHKKGSNIVIEMTWLILNMIGGICHKHFGYAHNYWALYIHIVNKLYMSPVVPLWYSKINFLDIVLGGNMELQYKKLAICADLALSASNSVEPFERPTKADEGKGEAPAPPPPEPREEPGMS